MGVFNDKLTTPAEWHKMPQEYKDLFVKVMTIQSDSELGGPHLYVEKWILAAPTAEDQMMLAKTGLISMVGKAERGPTAIEAIKKHKSAYLMAVGGSAYLVSKAIKAAKVVGFADLGMEAIYEFDVVDMPVTVAVDAGGTSAHITGPAEWQKRIASGEFKGIAVAAV